MWERLIKRNSSFSSRTLVYILLAVFAGLTLWLALIGLFGKPVLDDISFKVDADKLGILGQFKNHVLAVNGRVADAVLISLLYGLLGVSHIPYAGIAAILSLAVTFYIIYAYILRISHSITVIPLSLGSIIATYFILQAPYHSFYWMPSVFTYVIPTALLAVTVSLIILKPKASSISILMLYGCLIAFGTFNELLTLSALLLIGLWWLIMDRTRAFINKIFPVLCALLFAFVIMYFAPGSVQRRSLTHTGSSDISSVLLDSLKETVQLLITTLYRPGTLIVALTALMATILIVTTRKKVVDYMQLKKASLFLSAASVGTLLLTVFIANYTNTVEGGLAAPRTHIFFSLLIISSLLAYSMLLLQLRPVIDIVKKVVKTRPYLSTAIIGGVFLVSAALVSPLLKDDAIQITGRYYLWKQRERSIYDQKQQKIGVPLVEPLPIELLNDLVPFQNFYNTDLSRYYGVKSLKSIHPAYQWYREY